MTTSDIYHSSQIQSNINNPNDNRSDICYLPTSTTQLVSPPAYTPSAPPPPYATPPLPQLPAYSSPPALNTQMRLSYLGVVVVPEYMSAEMALIRDYMAWSIINIFVGGILLGLIGVVLSWQTKQRKLTGYIEGAKAMSRFTFTYNMFVTILSLVSAAFLIVYFVFFVSFINGLEN